MTSGKAGFRISAYIYSEIRNPPHLQEVQISEKEDSRFSSTLNLDGHLSILPGSATSDFRRPALSQASGRMPGAYRGRSGCDSKGFFFYSDGFVSVRLCSQENFFDMSPKVSALPCMVGKRGRGSRAKGLSVSCEIRF